MRRGQAIIIQPPVAKGIRGEAAGEIEPVLAVSGAICRSPLAMAEARSGLQCPVLDTRALAMPERLQALLGPGAGLASTADPLALAIAA